MVLKVNTKMKLLKAGVIFHGDINTADDFYYIRELIYERVKDEYDRDTFISDILLISFNKI